jgi:hypothetical protein
MKEKLNIRSLTWEREKRRLMNEVGVFGVVLRLVSDVSARKKNQKKHPIPQHSHVDDIMCVLYSFFFFPKNKFISLLYIFWPGPSVDDATLYIRHISIRWCVYTCAPRMYPSNHQTASIINIYTAARKIKTNLCWPIYFPPKKYNKD